MSRLIIKNLPPHVSDARLRTHFSQKGAVTDVRIPQPKAHGRGAARGIAFVGFKTDAEALAAAEYFNKSYIDSSRIFVEVVDQTKQSTSRPAKRPRLSPPPPSSSSTIKPAPEKPTKKDDKILSEFMQTMLPGKASTNPHGEGLLDPSSPNLQPKQSKRESKAKKEKQKPAPADAAEPEPEPASDLDWLKQRMSKGIKSLSLDDGELHLDEEDQDEATVKDEAPSEVPPVDPLQTTRDLILSTSRLFLRNLAFSCTESDLSEAFHSFGEITQVHIPLDTTTHTAKGLGFITFADPDCAVAAWEAMDRKAFQGRILHILPAVDRGDKGAGDENENMRKKGVKEAKKDKLRKDAGRSFNWAMLYMNSDAVVSSIADRLSISKADILNPESDNAAVKVAIAEAHIIQETKKYLEDEGVLLPEFDPTSTSTAHAARSPTTLIVKNFPYGTSLDTLRALFDPYGEILRLLLPPAGTLAVVEYAEARAAGDALRGVAYRRIGGSVVYLERAPLGIWDPSKERKKEGGVARSGVKPVAIPSASTLSSVSDEDGDGVDGADNENQQRGRGEDEALAPASGATLFIKNLSFSTTSEKLSGTFRGLPSFAFARAQTKPDPKYPADSKKRLSMGYGFVGFTTREGAKGALASMKGCVVDGHVLDVRWAMRGAEADGEGSGGGEKGGKGGKGTTTKIIMKNVPFEATKKDIRELFSSFGALKSVRLPRKFDSRTRGFAFLDFVSRREAEAAFEALRHAHLLGRHIVLEWAEERRAGDGDDGEESKELKRLRERVKVGYGDGSGAVPGRKRKLEIGDGDGGEDVEI
ncbi:hypothetical protein BOTBODRAFT_152433 [Botryobasidium botryosum FD-172 SS1]|uniref:RRM domain-containing protein n=1 Tax=Botryobasidium botryosum (strain FD-172 SS1) TaxID=930990 RepID=A0A067N805_BOTB1|nr:hypothetical protein BOTBODRAFT_152433 [Botryobasidium botryosum FD-172 SS1]